MIQYHAIQSITYNKYKYNKYSKYNNVRFKRQTGQGCVAAEWWKHWPGHQEVAGSNPGPDSNLLHTLNYKQNTHKNTTKNVTNSNLNSAVVTSTPELLPDGLGQVATQVITEREEIARVHLPFLVTTCTKWCCFNRYRDCLWKSKDRSIHR